jgi:hypothetical protein
MPVFRETDAIRRLSSASHAGLLTCNGHMNGHKKYYLREAVVQSPNAFTVVMTGDGVGAEICAPAPARAPIGGLHLFRSIHDSASDPETLVLFSHAARGSRGADSRCCRGYCVPNEPGPAPDRRCSSPLVSGLGELRARLDQVGTRLSGRRFHFSDRQHRLLVSAQPRAASRGGSDSSPARDRLRDVAPVLGLRPERGRRRLSQDARHPVSPGRPGGHDASIEPPSFSVDRGNGFTWEWSGPMRRLWASSPAACR